MPTTRNRGEDDTSEVFQVPIPGPIEVLVLGSLFVRRTIGPESDAVTPEDAAAGHHVDLRPEPAGPLHEEETYTLAWPRKMNPFVTGTDPFRELRQLALAQPNAAGQAKVCPPQPWAVVERVMTPTVPCAGRG